MIEQALARAAESLRRTQELMQEAAMHMENDPSHNWVQKADALRARAEHLDRQVEAIELLEAEFAGI